MAEDLNLDDCKVNFEEYRQKLVERVKNSIINSNVIKNTSDLVNSNFKIITETFDDEIYSYIVSDNNKMKICVTELGKIKKEIYKNN